MSVPVVPMLLSVTGSLVSGVAVKQDLEPYDLESASKDHRVAQVPAVQSKVTEPSLETPQGQARVDQRT
jgi:hypothetical protein